MSKQVKSPDFSQVGSLSATDNFYCTVGTARKGYFAQTYQIAEYVGAVTPITYQDLLTAISLSGLDTGFWYFVAAPTSTYAGGTTYALDDEVTDGSGNYYKSLQNANTGNALTDTSWWKPVQRDIYLRAMSGNTLSKQVDVIVGGESKSIYYDIDNDNLLYFTYVDTTQVGTTAVTSEETLASMTLWGNTLNNDGEYIEVTASGTFAANGNNKTVKLKIDSTDILDSGTTTINNKRFTISGRIYRTSSLTGTAIFFITVNGVATGTLSPTTSLEVKTSLVKTWSNDLDIDFTGQNGTASAGDIVLYTITVEHKRL